MQNRHFPFPSAESAFRQRQIMGVLRRIWPRSHARILSKVLGVHKRTAQRWLYGEQRIPLARLRKLERVLEEIAKELGSSRDEMRAEIAAREREPPVKRGWYVVKDHGDGFPPHNRQAQTLRKLGLLGPPKRKARTD